MEIGEIINTSDIGIIVHEENDNDNLLVEMNDQNMNDEDTVYVMDSVYQDQDGAAEQYFLEDEEQEDDSEELYNCNACGMNFASIEEHIEQYHSHQDVILDVADKVADDTVKCEPPEYINDIEEEDEAFDGFEQVEEPTVTVTNTSIIRTTRNASNPTQSKEMYACNRCDQSFTTLRSLSSHILNVHETKLQSARNAANQKQVAVRCAVRKTVAKDKNAEDSESEVIERTGDGHTCEHCNTVFQTAKSLKLHVRMHNPIKTKTLEEAAQHELETVAHDTDEKFYCEICEKLYLKTFEEIHVQMHNGEEKFNCKICNKLFPDEESISMHMNAHQETRVIKTKAELRNQRLPYACQHCGKEFARPHEKVKHERVHTGEKPYECEICGKCFRVSYCLTIHMRTHTDARPYVCPHCNKRFKAHSVYNHHLLTHSDERKYTCPYCPKTFKTSVQLSGHKNSHTKPFTCTECNRPFGSLYAVRSHMESHKRPNHNLKYRCDICGAKYARRFALNDHMKEQHKEVQLVDVNQVGTAKKATQRPRNTKPKPATRISLNDVVDSFELFKDETEIASESILPDVVEQEVTINFETEEVVEIDWLK